MLLAKMLLSNQYLSKGCISTLDVFHGDIHEGKVAFETDSAIPKLE